MSDDEKKYVFVLSNFTSLEKQLLDCMDYIPYTDNHKNVVSPKFIPIILEACTLIESILKDITDSNETKQNFKSYSEIHDTTLELSETISLFLSTPLQFLQPFKEWKMYPPKWWDAYNKLKHDRLNSYQSATYENAILSLSALHQLISKCRAFTDYIIEAGWINQNAKYIPELIIARREYSAMIFNIIAVESTLFVSPLESNFVSFKNGWPVFEECEFSNKVTIRIEMAGY
jgi:hypothetical protein